VPWDEVRRELDLYGWRTCPGRSSYLAPPCGLRRRTAWIRECGSGPRLPAAPRGAPSPPGARPFPEDRPEDRARRRPEGNPHPDLLRALGHALGYDPAEAHRGGEKGQEPEGRHESTSLTPRLPNTLRTALRTAGIPCRPEVVALEWRFDRWIVSQECEGPARACFLPIPGHRGIVPPPIRPMTVVTSLSLRLVVVCRDLSALPTNEPAFESAGFPTQPHGVSRTPRPPSPTLPGP